VGADRVAARFDRLGPGLPVEQPGVAAGDATPTGAAEEDEIVRAGVELQPGLISWVQVFPFQTQVSFR
jgi:hypothetical protein